MISKAIINDKEFDLEESWKQCSQNDLRSFAESMSRLANHVCGAKVPWLKDDVQLRKQDYMLLDDCFNISDNAIKYGNNMKAHIQMVKNMFHKRWKYKYYSEDSFLKDAIVSAWCTCFEKPQKI